MISKRRSDCLGCRAVCPSTGGPARRYPAPVREFFPVEPIPGYLYVHGAVLTSWFVWLVLQTSLVRGGNTALHRRMGVIGAIIDSELGRAFVRMLAPS